MSVAVALGAAVTALADMSADIPDTAAPRGCCSLLTEAHAIVALPPNWARSGSNAVHPRHHTVISVVAAQIRRREGDRR